MSRPRLAALAKEMFPADTAGVMAGEVKGGGAIVGIMHDGVDGLELRTFEVMAAALADLDAYEEPLRERMRQAWPERALPRPVVEPPAPDPTAVPDVVPPRPEPVDPPGAANG